MCVIVSALALVWLYECFINLPICKMYPQIKKINGAVMSKDQNLTFKGVSI